MAREMVLDRASGSLSYAQLEAEPQLPNKKQLVLLVHAQV